MRPGLRVHVAQLLHTSLALSLCLLACSACTAAPVGPVIDESKVVDLTYPFNEDTIYWPTAQSFQHEITSWGPSGKGYFYAAANLCAAEHGGTHMDAPIHFFEGRSTADQVPLTKLMGPAIVIDVSHRTEKDPDYRARARDIKNFEQVYGPIPEGAIVLLYTGWGKRWPDRKRYLGDDTPGDASNLHFPGWSRAAALLLVKRKVDAVGLDTASLDYGPSRDFLVHRVLNEANIPGLENVANLDMLPPRGAFVVAAPMKIEGGSGAPTRIFAILP